MIKKPKFLLFAISLFTVFTSPAWADDAQMKETLVRIINQLQSIKPFIAKAKREEPINPRIKMHFERFIGADGKAHNGLREDVDAIQDALIAIVNKESIEPRSFTPINDDFIGQ
jgi:RAQPRD family integrative conjugative element protein